MLGELRRAYRLYQTDSRADTIAAAALAVAVAVPTIVRLWRLRRR
jgi:hypothetical protein